MFIIPAIDLIDGHCVRLIKGQYSERIDYEENPVKQAQAFQQQGAKWLHVVDLDGAKAGKPVNTATISNIVSQTDLKIEVGGGLREQKDIENLLDLGVTRVIIGTKAVSDFQWFSELAQKHPGKIVLGLDARGSKVSTHGWLKDSPDSLVEFAQKAEKLPIAAIIYTDIDKDGMMSGPNLERTKELAASVAVPVVASGGVNTVEDILELKTYKNVEAAIIGRALYENTLTVKQAVEAAE